MSRKQNSKATQWLARCDIDTEANSRAETKHSHIGKGKYWAEEFQSANGRLLTYRLAVVKNNRANNDRQTKVTPQRLW